MQVNDILGKLKALSDPEAVDGMARYGITPESTYGVKIPDLRKIARATGKNHNLAQQLWKLNIRETRILASMIDDLELVTEEQMESWAKAFDYWEICDQCIMNLFGKSKYAYQKAVEWSAREEEFVKRAGFVMMARLAVGDKKAEDKKFEAFLPIIKREASDERSNVKKAVNWALRQIGKRNIHLNNKAIATAREIQKMEYRTAKWIASDALRELTGEAVQARLQVKKLRSA